MAKRVDPLKAKAAKQKKIAIGLSVLLLVVLAVQGPRTLKMLKGPSVPAAAPIPTAAVIPAGTTEAAVPPLGAAAAGAPPSSVEPAVLASTDQPLAGPGQLLSFELFESKDPFMQQVEAGSPSQSTEPAAAGGARAGQDTAVAPVPSAAAGKTPDAAGGSAVPPPADAGSTSSPAEFEAPAAAPATATTISVNRVSGPAEIGKEFPLEDPIFVLVSVASDGKSAEIGIAGGTYANGQNTIKLMLGKALTLQNTADGSRYELVLETVAGFVPRGTKK